MGDKETCPSQREASDLLALRDRMRVFTAERDWSGFHDPKSVLLALVGEVGELAELFQWLPAADAVKYGRAEPLHTRAGEEISDVLLYLILLADVLDIDLAAAANAKLRQAALRYPAPTRPSGPSAPATGFGEHG
jgi:dCTP diphosphatase